MQIFLPNSRPTLNAISAVVLTAVVCGLCLLVTACSYSVIPDKSLRQLDAIPPAAYKTAADATARAKAYRDSAAAAAPVDASTAAAYREAASEASMAAAALETAGDGILAVTGAAKPLPVAIAQGAQTVAPFIPPVGGVPWGELLGLAGTVVGAAYGVKKHREASAGRAADKWEESICACPDFGASGSINYDDPKVRAKALADLAAGALSDAAFKCIYPQG